MDQEKQTEVFSGEDVEQAVAAGLDALGLTREQVEVEILDEGSRGILGFGGRAAQVRLAPTPPPVPERAAPVVPTAPGTPQPAAPVAPEPIISPEEPDRAEMAQTVLTELLVRMGFDADIRASQAEPAPDEEEEGPLVLDVYGPGVDALIGRRGETLAALQRIVRLIVGRQLAGRANLVVDVEGYKQRRERKLRALAERMAEQAVRSGRTVFLEPMSAYERRIIHLALRNYPDVRTESVGDGHRRRVTIIPREWEGR